MSILRKLVDIPDADREIVNDKLVIDIQIPITNTTKQHYAFEVVNNLVSIPFSFAINELKYERPQRSVFSEMNCMFTQQLREEQKEVKKEAINILNEYGSVILALRTGFGKTCLGINLASVLKFKTLIVVNKIVLLNQWSESIKKFCPSAKIQKLTSKSVFDDTCDFYIINAINIEKLGFSHEFFRDIGTLILDEYHLLVAEKVSRAMHFIHPRYVIALSATPYRSDGLDPLLELYAGSNKIIRVMNKHHVVYKINTNIVIPMEKSLSGRVNWGSILDLQANNTDRNEIIIKIAKYFKDEVFLILVKRVEQGEYIFNRLSEENESVTSLLGSQQSFDKNARILIGTCQKCGTGFDHPSLTSMILAADVKEYFIQYLGRIFRKDDHVPKIFDLVDNNFIIKNHFEERKNIYKEHGGIIKNMDVKIFC